ncbi:Hsp70 family protein [Vibrio caribbeanicus]|uniref:DnaK-related protein n=1 Tax=Vibrio caribbeanicus ATCC BAA-2122 TaxID=796620 RepID=E3BKY1_9VIBR|nr:Hsp70 family protein [Vibrio caribbeanicus]EFP96325.1 DnaK-related protein [Vibrio caribbeanicus ATCC BAA-2122]
MTSPHYLVGIDLGTTNTVVAFCPLSGNLLDSPISIFEIDQLVGPGEVARRPVLPSFRYHPAEKQVTSGDLTLPWGDKVLSGDIPQVIIGEWAKTLSTQTEGRHVSSAKSWLSHNKVDRHAEILPWNSNQDVDKVSPVVASASYLNHIRQAWNYYHPSQKLEDQELVVTVPASFDESARKLTIEAAKLAGLDNLLLLEEPQAVCYDWYFRHQHTAKEQLQNIPLVLVCDIGGGTTDLSLVEAQHIEDELYLNRIGVGEHLMLGGDNIDLTLAMLSEQRLNKSEKLNAASMSKLIQQTREAKESLLQVDAKESAQVTMLGSGSKLVGGTKSVKFSREEVQQIVLEGFFPLSSPEEFPHKKRGAVVEFGLPYASDAAISRHLAEFLDNQEYFTKLKQLNEGAREQIRAGVLINGGVFNSPLIQQRTLELLNSWSPFPITLLNNPDPNNAVALGAVAFAKSRRGANIKIGGGAARSYFLHLGDKSDLGKAVCILAKGTKENQQIRLSSRRFSLTIGEPVRFNILSTTSDKKFEGQKIQNGMLIDVDPESLTPLPPYILSLEGSDAVLKANQKERVEVQLSCKLTELGTLKLLCTDVNNKQKSWQLEFEIRSKGRINNHGLKLHPKLEQSKELISRVYSGNKKSASSQEIKTLSRSLEKSLGEREGWDFAVLRSLFDSLSLGKKRRRRSEQHEKSWLRLAGYTLRPGFGDETDPWRIQQMWALYPQGIQFKSHQSWTDWWTFWRRVSGGLNQEQQEVILADIAKYLHPGATKNPQVKKQSHDMGYESMVRLAASLEQLETEDKTLLSSWFLGKAINTTLYSQAHWWAIGRLASRVPLDGKRNRVIAKEQVEQWLPKLLEQDWLDQPIIGFACVMMCRKTGDRLLDITEVTRTKVIEKLKASKSPLQWIELVAEVSELTENETRRAYGDTLPSGLIIIND